MAHIPSLNEDKPMISSLSANTLVQQFGLRTAGAPLAVAAAVVIAVHGRGADADSILGLADVLAQTGVAFVAPQAPMGAWYPQAFIAPIAANEPWLSQSLATIADIADALFQAGLPDERLCLLGFSQGACLALEAAIRRPRPYGAVIGFSGGYIGPLGSARQPQGQMEGARVFLGCSDIDSHIPLARLKDTTALMTAMGADVTERIYPGFGHAINEDEIVHARQLLATLPKTVTGENGEATR
jgi:phospholipase/carboxylesterase